jgi:hypothetical protein
MNGGWTPGQIGYGDGDGDGVSAPWVGEVGPLERGFTRANSPEDFKGWVVGFYNEQSDELAELPETLADAQVTS